MNTPQHHDRGTLLLIGGAEDKVGSRTILNRFVRLAGGPAARIAIIATASAYYDWVGQRYIALFRSLGAAQAELVQLRDRHDAMHGEALRQLDSATGIFITGGDQLKLTAVLGGTPVSRRIRERSRAGVAVAGTSAGASVASEHMMAYGVSGAPPRRSMMQFAPGLGLIGGVVIDQHFGARGRTGRLMTAVAHNPDLLGIGLDEDTAVEIRPDNVLSVIGRGSVMVVDGSRMTFTDIHHIPDHAPLTIFGMSVHVLSSGYVYDIAARTPHQPNEPPPVEPEIEGLGGEGI
ncbi:MAG TPA: cyanophycinase [Roseiflexaceae bacterium]|nr:cyanophycinase [Roseiflexaceae bacterium]